MGSEQQRQGGGATEASPSAAVARPAAGNSPPATSGQTAAATGRSLSSSVDDRLLRATIDVVATVGYEATLASQIVQAAGLSRTVFYRHYGGKQRAVVAAARWVLEGLDRTVRAALGHHDDSTTGAVPPATGGSRGRTTGNPRSVGDASGSVRVDPARAVAGLRALTEALAVDPPAAAVLVLEVPAAGTDAEPLRVELLALLDRILDHPSGLPAWSPAGAVLAVLHRHIAVGETSRLPVLAPELSSALARYA